MRETSPPAPSATIAEIIDAAPVSGLQRMVIALCILVSMLDGFDTQAIAFVAPAIAKAWSIGKFEFGFLFSATLLGTAIGSTIGGMLADRVGRRRLVIATTALFGLFSGACALATSYEQLLLFRLVKGLFMGGVIPNMLALAAEYAPARKRATFVTFTLWGFPFGAVAGGLAAGPLIAHFGWPSVFWLGAAAPLLLALVLLRALPESLRFLALDEARREQIVALLRRIDPVRADGVRLDPPAANAGASGSRGNLAALFRGGLAAPTILFSTTMFLTLFLTYLLINWMPTMLTQAGMPLSSAILGAVALNLGGILGSLALSRTLDRHPRPALVLAGGYCCAAIMVFAAGQGVGSPALALALLLGCGFFQIGPQLGVTAYSSGVYPVAVRGTGIGLIQGVGRIGSLIGPLVGGQLLAMGFSPGGLLELAVIPAALCALSLGALGLLRGPEAGR